MSTHRFAHAVTKPACFVILLLALTSLCSAAIGDSETFALNSCNFGAPCGTAPYATVTKTQTGTDEVTFKVILNDNFDLINSGFGFNSLKTDLSLVGTPSYTGVSSTFTLGTPGGNFDGFGAFTYALDTNANGSDLTNNTTNTLTFKVTSASGTLTLNDVDQKNDKGNLFAAEVSGCPVGGGPACTGFISGGTPVVPEPTSIAFFGTGLVGLGIVLRRKFARS